MTASLRPRFRTTLLLLGIGCAGTLALLAVLTTRQDPAPPDGAPFGDAADPGHMAPGAGSGTSRRPALASGRAGVAGELQVPATLLADGAEVQVVVERLQAGAAMFRRIGTARVAGGRIQVECDQVVPDAQPFEVRVEWGGLVLAEGRAVVAEAGARGTVSLALREPPSHELTLTTAAGGAAAGIELELRPVGPPAGRGAARATTDSGGRVRAALFHGGYEVVRSESGAAVVVIGRIDVPTGDRGARFQVTLPAPVGR